MDLFPLNYVLKKYRVIYSTQIVAAYLLVLNVRCIRKPAVDEILLPCVTLIAADKFSGRELAKEWRLSEPSME